MYVVVWDYAVKPEAVEAFAQAYGVGGPWTRLFRRGGGDAYLGSELYRSADDPTKFLTLDRWRSREAFTDFMVKHREAYAALDEKCGDWTLMEHRVGEIES
jgi:heme-degrading monooxygenase HmoA